MHNEKRFAIDCPVTVGVKVVGNGRGLKLGRLCDIGVRGARFLLEDPLPLNAPIALLVHFSDPFQRTTTLQFAASVVQVHAGMFYEIAVRFREGVQFLRGGLSELFASRDARWHLPASVPETDRAAPRLTNWGS